MLEAKEASDPAIAAILASEVGLGSKGWDVKYLRKRYAAMVDESLIACIFTQSCGLLKSLFGRTCLPMSILITCGKIHSEIRCLNNLLLWILQA